MATIWDNADVDYEGFCSVLFFLFEAIAWGLHKKLALVMFNKLGL